jgi:hypothetical protein
MAQVGSEPIIIDLGKARSKRIKDLKRGRGRLLAEIDRTVAELQVKMGGDGATLLPVIVVYRKKAKKGRNRGLGLFGC